jgi:hypothetical protein
MKFRNENWSSFPCEFAHFKRERNIFGRNFSLRFGIAVAASEFFIKRFAAV